MEALEHVQRRAVEHRSEGTGIVSCGEEEAQG